MIKRLAVVLTILGIVIIALPLAANAAGASPRVTSLKVYRTPSGSHKGAIAVIATANFAGKASDANGLPDGRSFATIVVTLRGADHVITASDTARLTPGNAFGRPVHFDVRVPLAASRLLAGDKGLTVHATVARELPTARKRAVRIAKIGPSTRGWRCMEAQAEGYTGTCAAFAQIVETPPPAPEVGFEQWQGGGPAQWVNGVWTPGGDEALLCVQFSGSGYGYPTQSLTLTDSTNGTTIGSVWTQVSQSEVPSSGSFADPSYLDVFVGGYAQISTGPTLTVQVPTSILSSPISPSTGDATLTALPQMQGFPTSWSLSPLTQTEAAGVC